jgi:hypothetical protein
MNEIKEPKSQELLTAYSLIQAASSAFEKGLSSLSGPKKAEIERDFFKFMAQEALPAASLIDAKISHYGTLKASRTRLTSILAGEDRSYSGHRNVNFKVFWGVDLEQGFDEITEEPNNYRYFCYVRSPQDLSFLFKKSYNYFPNAFSMQKDKFKGKFAKVLFQAAVCVVKKQQNVSEPFMTEQQVKDLHTELQDQGRAIFSRLMAYSSVEFSDHVLSFFHKHKTKENEIQPSIEPVKRKQRGLGKSF